ncbi:mitochondrial protein-like protein [Amylocarpus encephaloides]|uniref:MICOS complex subunit n=1 Tax=Amylocarpus encephaloides TaxID=45428 RepID=A0A9P7YPI1_9HELO|nr:mitochondrial protein-like protein [Amylocarpus encephaloides]
MASRLFTRQRYATGAVVAAGVALFPKTTLHAESPKVPESRKPIYDDYEDIPAAPSKINPPPTGSMIPSPTPSKSSSPTPTDRLAVQIGKTRMFIYAHVLAAENKVNQVMDSALNLESSFTSTIASLAPSPKSGEKLMPGSIYVLVAAMTGSIISRNRNIVLRVALPLAVGVGAGWVVLPVTMRNISDLVWKYEQRFPVVADSHIRTREGVEKAWRMARIHTQQAVNIVDDKVTAGREAAEGWVKKGK